MKSAKVLFSLFLSMTILMGIGMAVLKDKEPMYRHVVVFKFKESASKAQIDDIVTRFRDLKNKITTIIDYEDGTNVSPENLADGFTHCFLVTFKNKGELEKYLVHPAHKEFVEHLLPVLEKPFVIDYEVK